MAISNDTIVESPFSVAECLQISGTGTKMESVYPLHPLPHSIQKHMVAEGKKY